MIMTTKPAIQITQRPIRSEDQSMLLQLYAATRWEELRITQWSQDQKIQFLAGQYSLQHKAYQDRFPQADFELLLLAGQPVGRLYVDRGKDMLIIDISLFPHYRNQGIGTYVLTNLIAEANRKACSIRIHVERNNPAFHLYKRLGFQVLSEDELRFFMQYKPINKPGK